MPTGFRVPGSRAAVQASGQQLIWLALLLGFAFSPGFADQPRGIALAPHLAELVFAAGAGEALVGTVAWSDFPPEAAELPLIGDAFRLDLERIVGLNPDFALAWEGGTPTAAAERLERLGIRVIWIRTRTLDDIATALMEMGRQFDAVESAQAAARAYRAALAERPAAAASAPIAVFYQVAEQPLYTLGGHHLINEVLERCGARNVFADLDIEAAAVDLEAVLARAPRVIIAGSESDTLDPLRHWHKRQHYLPEAPALIRVDPDTLVRPTPRIIEGIDQLCAALSGADIPDQE